MLARALTNAIVGLDARPVEVEAHLQRGLPGFAIVGLADKACQKAKERVRSGVSSAELEWPLRRITVNLAPADLPKSGSGFNLPIALAVLAASGQVDAARLAGHAALGELALNGRLRPVAGTLAVAEAAARAGLTHLICAEASASEAALAGIQAVPVSDLGEACAYLRGMFVARAVPDSHGDPPPPAPDLGDVRGQERARRALEIAAAGRHTILLAGPPGTGKTMLARRLPGLLPRLVRTEAVEVTRIHSIAGTLPPRAGLISTPPFRAPHHSATLVPLVGGGPGPRPGEVSLAHRGVLLLDELPEFTRRALEGLRQPLEDGTITVSRATVRATFPASALLVATMNLCPCGARGDARLECTCSVSALAAHSGRVSRALLDRFDVVVVVPRARAVELSAPAGEASTPVRRRVREAHERLGRRQGALCVSTVVVEAAKGSGVLITDDFALETGREVYGVPGEITSARSAGANGLIRSGAAPVTSIPELLEDLGLEAPSAGLAERAGRSLSAGECRVLDAIRQRPRTLDELGRELGLDQAALAACVATLELDGVVYTDNGRYRPLI